MDIGLQIFSVKNALKEDYVGTLERIAAIGYKHVEFPVRITDEGIHLGGDITVKELKRQLDRLGLKTISTSARVNQDTAWDRIIEVNQELDCPVIVCPAAYFTDKANVIEYCGRFNRYAETCRKQGIGLYYHNHFQEFQVFEGHTVMDLMLEHMDEELVKFELDSYWALRGGADPAEWLHKYGTRCDRIHQKDLPAGVNPVNWFDVFGKDERITVEHLYKTQDPSQFAEIGEGIMDIKNIIDTARKIGAAKYMIVEQDATCKTELESVEISYRNMSVLLAL
ncbi:sugar phosphate isomerase/epimerase [Paenibacillus vulneris]